MDIKHVSTPQERHDWIEYAKRSSLYEGRSDIDPRLRFKVYPNVIDDKHDEIRSMVTKCLANVLYSTDSDYRKIPFAMYYSLIDRITKEDLTNNYYKNGNIIVMICGSNCYPYLVGDRSPEYFQYSDMDIGIYINPKCEKKLFDKLYEYLKKIVLACISEHQRIYHNLLCTNYVELEPGKTSHTMYESLAYLNSINIEEFKSAYQAELDSASRNIDGQLFSPFCPKTSTDLLKIDKSAEDIHILNRNFCSKNSIVVVPQIEHVNILLDVLNEEVFLIYECHILTKVVVEVPHYVPYDITKDRTKPIPLLQSPVYCSHNYLKFERNDSGDLGEFELFRILVNNRYNDQRKPAAFIDVILLSQYDSEQTAFWKKGAGYHDIWDPRAECTVSIPKIEICIAQLYNMLYKYNSTKSKEAIRKIRHELLIKIMKSERETRRSYHSLNC